MTTPWTVDRVLALAPDPASQRAAKGLASRRVWLNISGNGPATWGTIQGSGATPYMTAVDTELPVLRCSCPSRKQPCKHALALLLLFVEQPPQPADGVPEWAAKLLTPAKSAPAAAPAGPAAAKPVNAAARAKRAAGREQRVDAGVAEFGQWLRDLARTGLATASPTSAGPWEERARRLVDAQAQGLARQVLLAGNLPNSGEGWQDRLFDRLGRLALLLRAWERLADLPAPLQADVRALIMGSQRREDALEQGERVLDRWSIIGQFTETSKVRGEEQLASRRTWLWGQRTERWALLHESGYRTVPFEGGLVAGAAFTAELAYYPSNMPLRAITAEREPGLTDAPCPTSAAAVALALDQWSKMLAANPWLDQGPLLLRAVVPAQQGTRWSLLDAEGGILPLSPLHSDPWRLLALTGGHPTDVFLTWDGDVAHPLGAWQDGRWFAP